MREHGRTGHSRSAALVSLVIRHERARAAAAFYEERVAASLSKLVFNQVFPNLAAAISQAAPNASLDEVREASLVLLYRLLFLLYAEDRNLLPVGEKRYDDYALRHQRREVGERISDGDVFSASAGKIWAHDVPGVHDSVLWVEQSAGHVPVVDGR